MRPTVLLAEDEPALREIFCEVIRALGLDCLAANDGSEAIDLARRHVPQLIITDYMMPGRSGVQVIRAVRADPSLQRIPVILLSAGRPPESERQEAWRFLKKPVDLEMLESAVREALEMAAPAAGVTAAPDARVSPVSLEREEMLGWVSHEIKSPLSTAVTATQLAMRGLRNGDDPSTIERRLVQITRQLRRMDELVTSLLDAAQLQEGRLELQPQRVEMVELVRRVVAYWGETHTDIVFEPVFEAETASVDGDPERLRQIIDNFVSNAIKYGAIGGKREPIAISIRTDARHVVVKVTDRGQGIAPADLEHIFDRFHRVAGHGARGHGLGLYIAAALARLHGGALSVDSERGRGSTFAVTLPLAR